VTVTTPLSGTVCRPKAGLAMVNPHTKFEVFKFTYYEDMKGNEKCRNWDVQGWASSNVSGNVTIR